MNSDTTQNTTPSFTDVLDFIGNFDTICGIISVAIIVVLFVWLLLTFRKKINKSTKKQVDFFISDGKYIPQIYIELSEAMEYLRYFTYSNKWKKRIIRCYNTVFKGYDGKVILKTLNTNIKSKLFLLQKTETIKSKISKAHNELENIRTYKTKAEDDNREAFFHMRQLIYYRTDALKQCELLIDLIKAKNLIVIGSAGNGKTNLLCRLSEMLIKIKLPCLLINARDINTNCSDYIVNKLPFVKKIHNHSALFLRIYDCLLFLRRKHFFIIIDAINENDRDAFVESLGSLLDDFSKYKRIKFILSCRSEYFDSRYSQYFNSCESQPYKLKLDEIHYDERAKEKIFSVYSEYYNMHTHLPKYIKDRLLNSLLLMRIFFEVNSNQEKCNLELRNAEIYKMYIDMISSKTVGLDLHKIMNNISKLMVDSLNFDSVKIADLGLSSKDLETFQKCLDNNLIISRKLVEGTDITERTYEVIYFVFDELRDFCLSRYLLITAEDEQDKSFASLFSFLETIFKEKQSPLEGVLKYSYYYLKKTQNDDACILILEKYGSSDAVNIYNYRGYREEKRLFNNIGMSLIFTDFSDLKDFELDYVSKYIIKNPLAFWRIFYILLQNEYTDNTPDISLALEILLNNHSYEEICKIINAFFNDKRKFYSYMSSNEPRQIEGLCDFLDALKQAKGDFSFELKQFLLLIATIESDENLLYEFKEFALDTKVFDSLKERVKSSELIDDLDKIKERLLAQPLMIEDLKEFLKSLETGVADLYGD